MKSGMVIARMVDRRALPWIGLLAVLLSACAVWLILTSATALPSPISLAQVRSAQTRFDKVFQAYPYSVVFAYWIVFTLITALCLPGASVLMLLAGASFGLICGTLLATLASTTGATLTMAAVRWGLRNKVETRFAQRLAVVNAGLATQGSYYLLSLRLVPIIPFVPVNILCGLTRLAVLPFFCVSFIGMLPGTAAYVNAGMHLNQLHSLGDIVSWQTAGVLAILGAVPLICNVLVKRLSHIQAVSS